MNIRQELKGIGQKARAAALELAAAPATARQTAIEGMATRLVYAHDVRCAHSLERCATAHWGLWSLQYIYAGG